MNAKSLFFFGSMAVLTACSTDADVNDGSTDEPIETPTESVYPAGSIVWKKDTTVLLKDHFLVEKGKSLYIEQGATIIASNSEVKPEIVVLGNLYSMGTAEKPVVFTVEEASKGDRFSRNWGGIICGYDSKEVLLENTVIEYGGAQTTENSLSFRHELFKTETGEGVPALHFCNTEGSLVVRNSVFRNNAEDHMYITGGKSIIANNQFITCGFDGGEAINYKSECLADIAYNVVYDANTNALKLSNAGFNTLQSHLICYNNTFMNTGWRRPKVKGGSIWLEKSVLAELYNNLVYDCRWGLKESTEEQKDAASVITPNYYFASTEAGVAQMQASDADGILNGANDILSQQAGDKNPLFVNFKQQDNININVSSNEGDVPAEFRNDWDLHLTASSPALTGGKTDFKPHFMEKGITFEGLDKIVKENTFKSPAPASYFGAYGKK
ncbi:MAG: hypothetical protein RR202_07260 [Bacteroidales bacterium]